jgi:protoporphyrinogen oxidase
MSGARGPGRVLVLGAGPTGLGAAWRLQEAGHADYLVLEAARGPGGLAASVVDSAGFTWDLGGHVQFSHYAAYDRVLDAAVGAWRWVERDAAVWIDRRFVPYPLQYNLHRLDGPLRDGLLAGLREAARRASEARPPASFDEWLERTYGPPLADHFLRPYNAKVWGHPLAEMDWGWIADRVAAPDLARVERNVRSGLDDDGWGPNRRFRYPAVGGTGAVWAGIAAWLPAERVRYGTRAAAVDARRRVVRVEDGGTEGYDTLVSTIPLDVLARITDGLPEATRGGAAALRHSSVHVVGVGLDGPMPERLRTLCWAYFPEAASPYYRVTVLSNYSSALVPGAGAWSLMAEACESASRPVDAARLPAEVLAAMKRDGLVGPGAAVASVWHRRLEHGYPTPTLGRDGALAEVQPALEKLAIHSRGRFGAWKYEASNQDHAFMQGVELADRLLTGSPEVTWSDPARANSGEFLERRAR